VTIRFGRLVFLLVAAVLVLGLTATYQHRIGDYAGYLIVGDLGLAGRDIYRDAPPGINTWPPFFGLACIPVALLSHLSLVGARVAWLLLNWGALLVALAASVRLVYGKALVFGGLAGPTAGGFDIVSTGALLPLLLCIRWILSNFEHLQVNLIILALVLAGLVRHRTGRQRSAGMLIGAAAALKVIPILFVPYFFWRRQWRAMWWTAAAAAAWSVLPAIVYGPARFADQFAAWLDFFRRGQGVGKMNLSVYAMIDRIAGHRIVPFAIPGIDNLAPSGSAVVAVLLLGSLALVAGLACFFFRGPYDPERRATVAEWSIVLLVGTIFSPLTWKFYLVVLLLPMTLFVATWQDRSVDRSFRRSLRWQTWIAWAIAMAAANVIVGNDFAFRLEMGSALTISALIELATLYWYRARLDVATSRPPVPA
jgi:hypothetical protein